MSLPHPSGTPPDGLGGPNADPEATEWVTRTYLALPSIDALRPGAPPAVRATLAPIDPCPVDRWRALYRRIGDPWAWHDRDAWDDARLAEHLANPATRLFRVDAHLPAGHDPDAGMVELHRDAPDRVEIVYFGLHTAALGLGLGRWLVAEAVRAAHATLGAERVWLHTCTLDAPAALPNYLARGFTVERTERYPRPVG